MVRGSVLSKRQTYGFYCYMGISQRYPRFSKQHYWTESITACYLGMKIHSVLGVSDKFFQQNWPFYIVQLWSHFVSTFLLVLEVFLLHCIKISRETFFNFRFKTNTFSIPKHRWVHFYFSKHYFMAIRIWKHKYQTDEHIKCVTTVAIYDIWVRCVPWFNAKLLSFC